MLSYIDMTTCELFVIERNDQNNQRFVTGKIKFMRRFYAYIKGIAGNDQDWSIQAHEVKNTIPRMKFQLSY